MQIKEIQDEIVDEFSMFDDWMQRYEYIIELGKTLPLIDEKYKTEDNIIKGCQSKVWLHGEQKDDRIVFTADSDAILTKGIIAILIRAFSNQAVGTACPKYFNIKAITLVAIIAVQIICDHRQKQK